MPQTISIWLLVAALAGAGLVNALGLAGTRDDFIRWGFPRWWGVVTGALELASAALIALATTRTIGLTLAAVIIAAATVTVLRHKEYRHLAPLALFAVLIGLSAAMR